MIPCSSGNSPTMPVPRSVLQSRATSSTSATSSSLPSALASASATAPIRCVLSSSLPSLAWYVRRPRSSIRSRRRRFLSSSKKNRASARRARSTRSYPWRATFGSRTGVPETAMNRFVRFPLPSTTAK